MMSNWPPLVAMSVVTRWRSTFSSRTTQFSLLPVVFSHSGESFCMMIMSRVVDRGDRQGPRVRQRAASEKHCGEARR